MTVGIVKGDNVFGRDREGVNHRTSGNNSFHVQSNWRLNELMEERVTIEVGNLFQSLTTHSEQRR